MAASYDEGSALLVPPPPIHRMPSIQRLKLKMQEIKDEVAEEFAEELDELQSYPVAIWRTLVRFHRHTNVLEWSALAFFLAYCYGLLFGMIVNDWSVTTSTYFFAYTLATIGYDYPGNTSTSAYALLALYVFVSVLACSLLLGLFVAAMSNLSEMQVKHSLIEEKRKKRAAMRRGISSDDLNVTATENAPETSVEIRSRIEVRVAVEAIFTSLLRFLFVATIGTVGLVYLDRDFDAVEAVLFVMQTVATVGYGTTSLDTPVAKWFIVAFIIPGCGTWAGLVVACSRLPLVILKRCELQEHIIALRGQLKTEKRRITAHAAWKLLRSHIHLNMHSFSNVKRAVSCTSGSGSVSGSYQSASALPPGKPPASSAYIEDLAHLTPGTTSSRRRRNHEEHSLNQQEFIIHWLLATNQVNLQDVLDARDFFHTLDTTESGTLHLPTYMDEEDGDDFKDDTDDDFDDQP